MVRPTSTDNKMNVRKGNWTEDDAKMFANVSKYRMAPLSNKQGNDFFNALSPMVFDFITLEIYKLLCYRAREM